MHRTRIHPILLMFALAACGRDGGGAAAAPLQPLSRVVLAEGPNGYLARPGGLEVGDDGSFFVSDYFHKHLQAFTPTGQPLRTYGAPGQGPGEFLSVGSTVLLRDTLVGVMDNRSGALRFFGLRSGAYVGARRTASPVASGKGVNGEAWLGSVDPKTNFSMIVWPMVADSIAANPVQAEPLRPNLVPVPADYRRSEILRGVYAMVDAAPWADSALVGFAGSPYLYLVNRQGAVLDSLMVPARKRRGIPRRFVDRLHAGQFDIGKAFGMASGLFRVARLPDGEFALVHMDSDIQSGNRITSRVFVSLLSADRTRACVDREIPVSDASQPVVATRADTLYVLEQHVRDGETTSTATITKYPLSAAGCTWVPTTRTVD